MNSLRSIALLAAKDLRIELRTRRSIAGIIVLGVLIVAVLALGLGPSAPGGGAGGAGATAFLWVAYLFAGVLAFERTMVVERRDDALAALLLAPIDRGCIFAAKLLVNIALLLSIALVVTPVAIVLFRFDLSAAPFSFARITFFSMVGYAAVGTLFAALASSSRLQGGLLPLLVFPLCLPLVLASSRTMLDRLAGAAGSSVSGEGIILAFDVVFLVAGWLMFELALEP